MLSDGHSLQGQGLQGQWLEAQACLVSAELTLVLQAVPLSLLGVLGLPLSLCTRLLHLHPLLCLVLHTDTLPELIDSG